jgi:acetyl esterase
MVATAADCVVLSVDYRRSPEHKYPAAIEDARSALEWAASNAASIDGDASRIAVGGDSAGGAIAVALAKFVRDEGGPQIHAQLLFYPVTDYSEPGTQSYDERGVGYVIDHDFMAWIWTAYLPAEWRRDDPYLFPLQGDLAGLPAAIIYTAEYDLLRDEGAAYAEKLRSAGVPVEFMNADDQMHGFANHTESIDRAAELVNHAGFRLKQAFDLGARDLRSSQDSLVR